MITARAPQESDIEELAANMRGMDRMEIRVFCEKDESVTERLQRSVDESTGCLAVLEDGKVLCIFGFQSIIEKKKRGKFKHKSKRRDIGCIWCLATDDIEDHGFVFGKWARQFIDAIVSEHREGVYNLIHSQNKKSQRWLRILGCTVHPGAPLNVKGEAFTWFEKKPEQLVKEVA